MNVNLGKRLLNALLVLVMVCALLPVSVSATTADDGVAPLADEGSALYLNKTATLQDDGTYTITLESYSTGLLSTAIVQTPTDIVLVLDVSGSMADEFTYSSEPSWQLTDERMGTLIGGQPENVYHKCPDGTYSPVTWETYWRGLERALRYVCNHCHASRSMGTPANNAIPSDWNLYEYTTTEIRQQKMVALQNAVNSFLDGVAERNAEITNADEQHKVAIVKFASETKKDTIGNDTYVERGNTYNYTQTVAGLTAVTADTVSDLHDSVNALDPGGATASDKGLELAQGILANKTEGRNQVVILFTDGDPTYSSNFNTTVANRAVANAKTLKDADVTVYTIGVFDNANPADTSSQKNAYLNAVSSNYPYATSYTSLGTGGNNGYYKTISTSGSLQNIFEEIEQSITSTTVTLDANAQIRDYLNDGFVITADSQVTAQTDNYSGRDRDGNRTFANNPQSFGATIAKNSETNTVSVSGFDYSKEYLVDGTKPDDNNFTAAQQGKKLIVTITKVEARDAAVTNALVYTNKNNSGIYTDDAATNPVGLFPRPQTQLNSKAYVMDYAKPVTLTDLPSSVLSLDGNGMHGFATAKTTLTEQYGTVSANQYTPTTTNWNGYDEYYIFGQWNTTTPTGVTTGNNTWTKVTVMPANNVYYEDDFVSTTNDGTTATGTVGIEYTGTWTTVGDDAANVGEVDGAATNDGNHGWIESKDNDTGYSDGTVHQGTAGATATFTFTGTGVDIYSRTNGSTGTVLAVLTKVEEGVEAVNAQTKVLVIDNLAQSGDYYQIPTLFFNGLEHGTYTVKLTVTSAAEGRTTYYLDGIRVYNPLSDVQEQEQVVQDAYKEEISASFMSIRDMLIDAARGDLATAFNDGGVVFIDYNPDISNEDNSAVLGTYVDYGPKNEVYLATNQAVYLNVGTGFSGKLAIGLKGPEGETATAQVTNGSDTSFVEINGTSDQYFTVTPDVNGNVIIKNTGSNLLSVTKLKISGEPEITTTSLPLVVNEPVMMAYAASFASAPVVEYVPEVEAPAEENPAVEETTPAEEETPAEDTPAEEQTPVEEPEQGEVVIENPENYPTQDEQGSQQTQQPQEPVSNKWIGNLFNSIRNLFRR